MVNRSYYVGVLLTASGNHLNKIQFVTRKNGNGSVSLFSRVSDFNSPLDIRRMTSHGRYGSLKGCEKAIAEAADEMRLRGITVPGIEMLRIR